MGYFYLDVEILPNITLGYVMLDTGESLSIAANIKTLQTALYFLPDT